MPARRLANAGVGEVVVDDMTTSGFDSRNVVDHRAASARAVAPLFTRLAARSGSWGHGGDVSTSQVGLDAMHHGTSARSSALDNSPRIGTVTVGSTRPSARNAAASSSTHRSAPPRSPPLWLAMTTRIV